MPKNRNDIVVGQSFWAQNATIQWHAKNKSTNRKISLIVFNSLQQQQQNQQHRDDDGVQKNEKPKACDKNVTEKSDTKERSKQQKKATQERQMNSIWKSNWI